MRQPRISPRDYLVSYLDDVARVDLPGADINIDPVRMTALMRALARNTATESSAAKLSVEAGIEVPSTTAKGLSAQSVRKYLDALTRVLVVEEQPAWATHPRSKVRLRTQPKWYYVDPSLAAAALGASSTGLLDDLNTLELLFESLCVRDVRVHAEAIGGAVSAPLAA